MLIQPTKSGIFRRVLRRNGFTKIVEGSTRQELILALRFTDLGPTHRGWLTLQEIADHVGYSRQNISLILEGTKGAGRLPLYKKYVYISPQEFKDYSNLALAKKYPLEVSTIRSMRKNLDIVHVSDNMLKKRQVGLCMKLFGNRYVPDEKFEELIIKLSTQMELTEKKQERLFTFYFGKSVSSLSKKTYRTIITEELKYYVKHNQKHIKKLIKPKYIKEINKNG